MWQPRPKRGSRLAFTVGGAAGSNRPRNHTGLEPRQRGEFRSCRAQVMGRVVGAMGAGSAEEPIRYASAAAAADLPSAIAHTISDWPRPISPATNTPGTEVANEPSLATFPRASMVTPTS